MPTAVRDLAKNFPDLPQKFLDCLPDECPYCGVPTLIRVSLTGLHCANPRCAQKVSQRVQAIANSLNILGFGPSTADDFVNTYDILNPMDIFDLDHTMLVGDGVGAERSTAIIDAIYSVQQNRTFLLWEAVAIQNLPGIQTSAQKLFSGYSDIGEFYDDMYEGGVEFIHGKISTSDTVGARAVQLYGTLAEFEDDIREGVSYLRLADMGTAQELTVVVSDQAGTGFQSKTDFYNRCKAEFEGRFFFNFAGSVSQKSTEFLIWAGADGTPARYTSKVGKVEDWNAAGKTSIPIMTGQEFIDFLNSGTPLSDKYSYVESLRATTKVADDSSAEYDFEDMGLL